MTGKDGLLLINGKKIGYIDNFSLNESADVIEVSSIGKDYREDIEGPIG